MREDKKRGTIVAFNCTMEVEQEHFRERKMLAQANVCTIDINTVRLGIKRCFSSLNQSSLKQLFKQSKDGIKEEIFRQFLLSSKEEQHDVLTLWGQRTGPGNPCFHCSPFVLQWRSSSLCLHASLSPTTWGAQRVSRCSLHQLSPCSLLNGLHVMACPSCCCPLRIFSQVSYPSFASTFA